MPRLIDADALKIPKWDRECRNAFEMGYREGKKDAIIEVAALAPTIEAELVKHGRWIEHIDHEMLTGYDECSVCHFGTIGQSNYCPNCGARMDGDSDA